jgi:hypothetical protein
LAPFLESFFNASTTAYEVDESVRENRQPVRTEQEAGQKYKNMCSHRVRWWARPKRAN